MAKREVGYVELIWTCPTCGTHNPGPQTTCAGCGAQPDDVKFELPAGAGPDRGRGQDRQAKAGPDIHCGYCGARNRTDAKVCRQCGADLSAGAAHAPPARSSARRAKFPSPSRLPQRGTANTSADAVCRACGDAPARDRAACPATLPSPAVRTGTQRSQLDVARLHRHRRRHHRRGRLRVGGACATNDVAGTVADALGAPGDDRSARAGAT
ncbi:MAG: zinc finger protein [Caldilineaceae bacterium]